jgi:hypothetical protein
MTDLSPPRARIARSGVGHTFEWLGLRPGPHLLHATAHGSKGTAHSAPVGVEVFLTSTTPTELPVSAPSGTTAAMLAAATGVDEGSITADGEIADATAPGAGSAAATRPASSSMHRRSRRRPLPTSPIRCGGRRSRHRRHRRIPGHRRLVR